ncbi:hypothetical protein BV924_20815 [Pectobacterium odoriferum]|uniref:Uncharacterized protein n=1 Tax=Pectobacterium odoriferum TaxID=78398 RepID=A0ABD6VLC3_9GAMM|nr:MULTISPECIES: hypothetical protein [Pectobacterium]MBB1527374.1 hypothetical protein [Pectobacterium carotovorum subsp. carotovorum]POD97425.1 hypothetical protein BVY06_02910 [Pectobacterium odoriferum]POE08714.1 hypothetical protein BV924_20815 [Pectobacterium odoriferum]POE23252.1 hypothetical protein BV926_20775 [Pectobacterium odoriferum]POE27913.1 hypothetical protein BV919_20425 [Pectobacterium odoriferum]
MKSYFDFNNFPLNVEGRIPLFERDESEEKRLDEILMKKNNNVFFSLSFYCRRLNYFISQYNDVNYEKINLIRFLEREHFSGFYSISKELLNFKYVEVLGDFIRDLRDNLNIREPLTASIDTVIDNIVNEIELCNGDLVLATAGEIFKNSRKCSFGYVLIDRRVNFYVCDNLSELFARIPDSKVPGRHSVIIFNFEVDRNALSDVFLHFLPIRLVTIKNGKMKSFLDMRTGFRENFYRIMSQCGKIINSKKHIDSDFKDAIIELNKHLDYSLLMVEELFDQIMYGDKKQRDVKYIKHKLISLSQKMINIPSFEFDCSKKTIHNQIGDTVDSISRYFERSEIFLNLPEIIFRGVSKIRENANLYRVDSKVLFKENNISAALCNWLDGRFDGGDFKAITEESIGNGRTDISIFYQSSRVAIIESKLIPSHSDKNSIKKNILNGFHQVFIKYASFLPQQLLFPPRLYLIIFSFDAEYKNIREQIFGGIQELQEQRGISLIEGAHISTSWYKYIASSVGNDFPDDEIFLDIIIADLRVSDNKDRIHGRYK